MKRPFATTLNPKRTLSGDLTRGLILAILIATFIFGPLIIFMVSYIETQALHAQAETLSENLRQVLSTPLWELDQETLNQIATAYLQNENVVGIIINDNNRGDLFKLNPNLPESQTIRQKSNIHFEGTPIGTVEIILSTQVLNRVHLITTTATLFGAIIMSIGIVLMARWLLVRLLTRPLNEVITGVENIAKGEYNTPLARTGLEDMDAIIDAVNVMAQQISWRDTQLNELIITLEASEHRYRELFENANDIIYTHDLQGKITSINSAGKQLLGDPDIDIIGMNVSDFISSDDLDQGRDIIISKVKGMETTSNKIIEMIINKPDGKSIPIEVNLSLIMQGERITEIQGIARNISDRKLVEEQAAIYLTELEKSNKELQNFAYVASHDLQEPLRKIQTFGDRLQNKYASQLDERGADYLQRMHNAADRMSTLIADLLSFSRVTSQAKPFVAVDLTAVLQNVLDNIELQIIEKNALIAFDPLPIIQADTTQMNQLLQNLISNSLKFSQPDIAPHIQIRHKIIEDQKIEIRVIDNGIGFEENFNERIFDMFQRLHSRQAYQGTGIGLAICRKIVERHHGTITAVSQLNCGATFIIILPTHPK